MQQASTRDPEKPGSQARPVALSGLFRIKVAKLSPLGVGLYAISLVVSLS
jgi:hypothetical protein